MSLRLPRIFSLKVPKGLSPYLDPLFDVNVSNITVHFIRARSNLILSCSSEGFPICICYSVVRGKGVAEYGGRRERGKSR